jgi:hypothetical protein
MDFLLILRCSLMYKKAAANAIFPSVKSDVSLDSNKPRTWYQVGNAGHAIYFRNALLHRINLTQALRYSIVHVDNSGIVQLVVCATYVGFENALQRRDGQGAGEVNAELEGLASIGHWPICSLRGLRHGCVWGSETVVRDNWHGVRGSAVTGRKRRPWERRWDGKLALRLISL